MNGKGLPRMMGMIGEARAAGELNIDKGSLGWKYRPVKAKKTKAVASRAKPKSKAKRKNAEPDLFDLCQRVERGEIGAEALAATGMSVRDILDWYVQEGIARDMAERKG